MTKHVTETDALGLCVRTLWGAIEQQCSGIGNVASWDSTQAHFSLRFPSATCVVLPKMNYGKKDEDADTGLVKIDRTQVFQEGKRSASRFVVLVV